MLDELLNVAGAFGSGSSRWLFVLFGVALAGVGFVVPTWTIAFWVWVLAATLIVAGLLIVKNLDD